MQCSAIVCPAMCCCELALNTMLCGFEDRSPNKYDLASFNSVKVECFELYVLHGVRFIPVQSDASHFIRVVAVGQH